MGERDVIVFNPLSSILLKPAQMAKPDTGLLYA